jgi:hypothetical protein
MTLLDVQASGRDNDHCTGTVDGAVDVGTCAQLRRLVTRNHRDAVRQRQRTAVSVREMPSREAATAGTMAAE